MTDNAQAIKAVTKAVSDIKDALWEAREPAGFDGLPTDIANKIIWWFAAREAKLLGEIVRQQELWELQSKLLRESGSREATLEAEVRWLAAVVFEHVGTDAWNVDPRFLLASEEDRAALASLREQGTG